MSLIRHSFQILRVGPVLVRRLDLGSTQPRDTLGRARMQQRDHVQRVRVEGYPSVPSAVAGPGCYLHQCRRRIQPEPRFPVHGRQLQWHLYRYGVRQARVGQGSGTKGAGIRRDS